MKDLLPDSEREGRAEHRLNHGACLALAEPVAPRAGAALASVSLSEPPWEMDPKRITPPHDSSDTRVARMLVAHFEAVWATLRRLGVARGSVDDAAQEVFIIAARKLAQVEAGRERAFLCGIALGVAANCRRTQRTAREQPDEAALLGAVSESPAADDLLEEKRLRELLDQILDALAEELRTAFVLFELEGFSEREIADLCAIPLGTVASRLRRARCAFQQAAQRHKRRLAGGFKP